MIDFVITWRDCRTSNPKIEGIPAAVPHLKNFGVTAEQLIQTFDFKDARFILLWTGEYDYRCPSLWDGDRPKYADQMQELRQRLDKAKAKKISRAFIIFHYPVFARSGLGPIPEPDNPHKSIAAYAKDLELVVFNGHVHTTELYDVDGVKYLMLGGGGAEQDPILSVVRPPKRQQTIRLISTGRATPPTADYNHALVDVDRGRRPNLPSVASDRPRLTRCNNAAQSCCEIRR